jgi:hypothetical protein
LGSCDKENVGGTLKKYYLLRMNSGTYEMIGTNYTVNKKQNDPFPHQFTIVFPEEDRIECLKMSAKKFIFKKEEIIKELKAHEVIAYKMLGKIEE